VQAYPGVTVKAIGPAATTGDASVTGTAPAARAVPGTQTGTKVMPAQALTVLTPTGSYRLQAAPDLSSAQQALHTMLWLLLPGIPLVLILVAALTWFAMGRALRPVEAIRAEFAEITAHDLHRRVPDPRSGDEVSRLAGTMNLTLNQLQRAVRRLRTFTSDASHELRTPLTTLRMRLELAVARPDQADWPEIGRECLQDAEQLQAIVDDLLLLARLDAGQQVGRDEILATELIRQVGPDRTAGRRLIIQDDAPEARVIGSRIALSRLLANLLDNAVRHAGSTVQVQTRHRRDQVVIEVTDDGPGIAEGDRARVFDRFTRLDDARTRGGVDGGTGLGLAIARDIALAHGGTLVAAAPVVHDGGARLVLTLPALQAGT
jgi:signal transduction histidine kinase